MNVLLTSAGRRTYLINYFKQALKGEGKVFASNSIYTYSLSQADCYVLTPQIYDEGYIDFLLEYCRTNKIDVVISLFDVDLPVLAENKSKFKKIGTDVIVSDPYAIDICNDKWKTYNFILELGLRQPHTYISLDDAKQALQSETIHFPLILKPRWGMGSIGIYKVDNINELDVLYEKLHREIFKTYLRFESAIDKDSCVLIQEIIEGQEYGIEVLNDLKGNYVTTLAKRKIAMRAGETDIAEVISPDDFIAIGKMISGKLKHIANLDVDVFLTDTGEIVVLEMNCRFGGQYPFSHLAGANFPKQIIEWCKGKETNERCIKTRNLVACKELIPVVISDKD